MYTKPQQLWGALAVVGFVLAMPAGLYAQSDESENSQRDSQRSTDQNRSDRDRDEASDRDRSRQSRQSDDDRGREPWESRSRDRSDNRSQQDRSRATRQQDSERPGLGVSFATEEGRPVIRRVHSGSPAEEMGLRSGDRITHINGEEVRTARDVIEEVRKSEPGDDVEIEVTRDGEERSFEGELETRREALVFRYNDQGRQSRSAYRDQGSQWNDEMVRRSFSMSGDAGGESYGRENYGRQQDVQRQLDSLDRQVERISREIDRLRRTVGSEGYSQSPGDSRRSSAYRGGETQATYSEYDDDRDRGQRTSHSYDPSADQVDRSRGSNRSGSARNQERFQRDSPGGVTGGERTQPQSEWIDDD